MKICAVRIDKMGDMILTLPVIEGLKKSNNRNIIDIVCSENNFKVCNKISIINKVFLLNKKFSQIFNTIQKIRKENYDFFYTFSPGWTGILIGIFSKSKSNSLLILQSRYKLGLSSKFLEKIVAKLFFNNIKIVNRNLYFQQNKSIHQTILMNSLVLESGVNVEKNSDISNLFKFDKRIYEQKEICLIHLSSKWINKFFSEERFINLLNSLQYLKKHIVMTTDSSSKIVFNKIYEKYKQINNQNFNNIKNINEILILDQLDFNNWTSMINSSSYVITPECGCTHIASLTNCKLCVIYDAENLPDMISEEYAPWKKNYTKLIFNDDKLEKKLISFCN